MSEGFGFSSVARFDCAQRAPVTCSRARDLALRAFDDIFLLILVTTITQVFFMMKGYVLVREVLQQMLLFFLGRLMCRFDLTPCLQVKS